MGLDHILNIHAYDHLLFIGSLLLVYSLKDWRTVLILLTAFTVGHGISLISALVQFFPISRAWVEFLIPATILVTAFIHLLSGRGSKAVMYPLALIFGLIHGMAYARDFVEITAGTGDIVMPLLGFNLGVEAAQIGFGIALLFVLFLFDQIKSVKNSLVRMFIFGVIITLALQLLLTKWMW